MKTFKIKCMYCKSSFEVKLPTQIEDGKVACKSNMFKAKCIHCTKIFVVRLPIEDRTKLSPHFREMPVGLHHPRTHAKPLPPQPPLQPHLTKPAAAPLEVPAECITELEEPHEVIAEPGPHAWGPHREDHEPTKTVKEKEGFWTKPKLAAVLLVVVFFLGLANSITNVAYANDIVSSDARDSSDAGGVITISGTVIDFDTTVPIGDVRITILDTSQSTVTSPEGFYVLEDVQLGEHTIQASATGFQTVNKKVKLTLAPEKIIDFELQEGSGTIDFDESYSGNGGDIDDEDEDRSWNLIGMLTIIFSILALFGAYLAYTQYMFWACSTAAFFGILSFGFGIGAFLGVFALILILVSKERFRGFNISEPAIDTST